MCGGGGGRDSADADLILYSKHPICCSYSIFLIKIQLSILFVSFSSSATRTKVSTAFKFHHFGVTGIETAAHETESWMHLFQPFFILIRRLWFFVDIDRTEKWNFMMCYFCWRFYEFIIIFFLKYWTSRMDFVQYGRSVLLSYEYVNPRKCSAFICVNIRRISSLFNARALEATITLIKSLHYQKKSHQKRKKIG